jgi:hypothetical protein
MTTRKRTKKESQPKPDPKLDLESLYKLYPRKEGKTVGMKKVQAQIKTEADFKDLQTAIRRFVAHLRAKGTGPEYIPHFKTFMTSWRDWLDPEAGKVTLHERSQPSVVTYTDHQETEWGDPARVRAILDRAMAGKSSLSHGSSETQEGLVSDMEETGPDDCD